MKTNAKTLMILSTFLLAIVAGGFLISTSAAKIKKADAASGPYIQTDEEWWNSTDAYTYNDSYQWDNFVWGVNGSSSGTNQTYFDVFQNTTEVSTVSENWSDYYMYVYLDYSNQATVLANVSDPAAVASEGLNFTGGESYYWIWFWISQYSYTTKITENYTIYNLATDSSGNLLTDENGSYIQQPGIVSPSNFHHDNTTYDQNLTHSLYYDSFFDTYNGNGTLPNETYTEFDYGYEIYQYAGSWIQVGSSGNNGSSVSSAMQGIFQGYSVYDDRNHNGHVDVVLTEDPENPGYYYVSNDSEWLYNMIFTNCTSFSITPVVNGTNSETISFTLNGIGVALVDYQDTYGVAYADNNVTYCYIPRETTTFTLSWSSTRVDLKAQHEMSETYDWNQYVANGKKTTGLPAEPVLAGTSLCINYWGDSWSESSAWTYTTTDNKTDSTYMSDDTYSFSDGSTDVMAISANGTYVLNGTLIRNQGLVVMPQGAWSAQSNYYESNSEDTATGSYNWKETIYLFGVTLNDWSGGSFKTDPVFSTLIHGSSSSGSQGPESFPWYLIVILLVGVVAIVVVVVVIKKKGGKRE